MDRAPTHHDAELVLRLYDLRREAVMRQHRALFLKEYWPRDAAEASREAGERMVADIVAWLGRKQRDLLAAWDPERSSRLRTFGDVERFWAEAVVPRLSDFKSLRSTWYEKTAPDVESRWRESWEVPGFDR